MAAAGRTATEGYRVRIVSTNSDKLAASSAATQTAEGVFDPARGTGRLLLRGQGLEVREVRFVGDVVYTQLPAGSGSNGKRWVAHQRSVRPDVGMPAFVQLTKLAWQDQPQALAPLRSAVAVHEQGRVSGAGWVAAATPSS